MCKSSISDADYTLPNTFMITPGERQAQTNISILDDSIAEDDEEFVLFVKVRLVGFTYTQTLDPRITIVDDEGQQLAIAVIKDAMI